MLQVPAPFPFPGSFALFEDLRWRVLRHNLDGTALLGREPQGRDGAHLASFNRAAPIDELVDPALVDLPITNLSPGAIRTLCWLDLTLRGSNIINFDDLKAQLADAAHTGDAPAADGYQLAGLLRRLGWRRGGKLRTAQGRARIWERTQRMAVPA